MTTMRLLTACYLASVFMLSPALAEKQPNLSSVGLKTIQSTASCELVAPLKKEQPLIRRKSNGELNAFALGTGCPKNIEVDGEAVHVVAFAHYGVSNHAFVGYGKNGKAMKIVRNFNGKTRGVSGYKGFRYIFYDARN